MTGTFPVPFNFEGTGPLFCWPYLLPDGSVVLVPYLSLQKQADPTQVEKLLLVPPMVGGSLEDLKIYRRSICEGLLFSYCLIGWASQPDLAARR